MKCIHLSISTHRIDFERWNDYLFKLLHRFNFFFFLEIGELYKLYIYFMQYCDSCI